MNAHYQVAEVGSGSAGKDAALLAARAGLRTVVIEAGSLGGTGLHRGVNAVRALRACVEVCVPFESLEPLRTELAASGIVNPALMAVSNFGERISEALTGGTQTSRPECSNAGGSSAVSSPLPPVSDVARLSLSIGRLFMEFGESAGMIHEEIFLVARSLGCDSAEVYCQHAAIIVTLRRGEEFCAQMGKVGEHGVNLRGSEAVRDVVRRVSRGDLACSGAQSELDNIPHSIPSYPVWLVCLCTGLACSAFGRLLGADWLSFFPVLVASAAGQWLRRAMMVRHENIFITTGVVSFVSAFLAGAGARLLGSSHLEIATVSAVLLLVPGVAVLNTQTDVIHGKPNLAAARSLRVIYILLFMTLGLVTAQRLVVPGV